MKTLMLLEALTTGARTARTGRADLHAERRLRVDAPGCSTATEADSPFIFNTILVRLTADSSLNERH
ncbi:MAG: hypothetical protein KDI51_01825 [Xanthomonadales bacterium]|nr:hypothetical protein [Xanthomonadales bacterium]MCB1633294.1 hypothetical protein [Xanthomonadales bacterium]